MGAANRQVAKEGVKTDVAGSLMLILQHGKMYVCRTNGILPLHSGVVSGD